MAKYFYIAQSLKGEKESGTLEAKDKHQLARVLRQKGYVLISAELEEKKPKKKLEISLPFLGKIPLVEKMMFTRNLQVMIAAGIPLPRALKTLSSQSKSKKFRNAILDVVEQVIKGESFSESLIKYPNIFPELFFSMVKVGEEAGTLEDVLKTLTQQMEREHELSAKIKGAMIYPAVIISAMFGIGVLMLITVVPKLAETFDELGIELPITTKIVIATGTFLAQFWYLLPLIILFFLVLFKMILKSETGKKVMDKLFLKIPIISPIVIKTNSAYLTRTLSSLIASGVPIVRALEVTAGTLGNFYFKKAMREASKEVRKGGKLSEALKLYQDVYPLLIIQMIEVGEETGETSSILAKLADFFEDEVGNATKNLASVIEPALMILIGAAVGFFAISMVQPIYSMLGTL